MIAKILSFSLLFLVAIIVAQIPSPAPAPAPCDNLDACFVVVSINPCLLGSPDCLNLPHSPCKEPTGTCSLPGGCDYNNAPNYPFVNCDDNDLCTTDDFCLDGNCTGLPVICDDICKTNQFCNPDTGLCVGDNVECAPETCKTGTCVTASGGCVYSNDDTLPCDDGLLCTTDVCVNGACISTPITCASKTCMTGTCNAATGMCDYVNNNTLPCTDNLLCTTDTCVNGACNNVPVVCPVQPCKNGVCNSATGQCDYTSVTCPSRNCSTVVCNPTSGGCEYTPITCPTQPCMLGSCSATTGQCVYTPLNCSDNNPCTTDTCVNGACVHTPMNCTRIGSNTCQFNNGTCNPSTGQCVYATKPNGTTCDDNNACTTTDKCTSGQCTGTNSCCYNKTKAKCGICVSDCCSDYDKVLKFFNMRGSESDVTEVGTGCGCSYSQVCCGPTSSSVYSVQSDHCVVRKA